MKIKMQGLSKQFDNDKEILKSIDFCDDIHTLAIIGPSGDGKSTLLRILGGLLSPSDGNIWVNDEQIVQEETALTAYRRKIGFVFQQGGLFRHMTALDNIAVPLIYVHGLPKPQAKERAVELLTRFGLYDDAYKKPSSLSGGQQQRIAIARAIAPKPQILLLDEPTSALDPEYTTEVLNMINELKEDGMDFIIVTHEMGFARHACDKAAFLHGGRLLEYGDSDTVFTAPKTEELKSFLSKLLEWKI